ncbi:MAG TPA: hypothetical protein PKA90_09575 [Ignavibacteria bacterium]|nr:hypothetical protein [Ignavibacteria bacterium]HMR40664.1 hypothetical protein [Ignavibacteria bacterium]
MNTNHKYISEDLLHSLPDYISKNITDTELINAIESAISTDPDFKTEYLNLSETLNMIGSYKIESPSEAYFNNLSVRINQSIHKETRTVPFLERFGVSLKFALSALVVLFFITTAVYYFYNSKSGNNLNTSDQNKVNTFEKDGKDEKDINDKQEIRQSGKDNQLLSGPDLTNATDLETAKYIDGKKDSELLENKNFNDKKTGRISQYNSGFQNTEPANSLNEDKSVFPKEDELTSVPFKATVFDELAFAYNSDENDNNSDFTDNSDNTESAETLLEQTDDILISGESDDDFLEEDLFELTPEEQKEIVIYLKQS